jgi:hypothetical protein
MPQNPCCRWNILAGSCPVIIISEFCCTVTLLILRTFAWVVPIDNVLKLRTTFWSFKYKVPNIKGLDKFVKIYTFIKFYSNTVAALIDTGGSVNLISSELYYSIPHKLKTSINTYTRDTLVLANAQKISNHSFIIYKITRFLLYYGGGFPIIGCPLGGGTPNPGTGCSPEGACHVAPG